MGATDARLTREDLATPLPLPANRVRRTYRGGVLLDRFRRSATEEDGPYPEDWVGSMVTSRLAANEGQSKTEICGQTHVLKDLAARYGEWLLGAKHCAMFGTDPSLLVKLIDSCERLQIQTHPSRELAQTLFGADHGKTEAWIVLDTRVIDGQKPYVLLGFKKSMVEEEFREATLNADSKALESMLHKFSVKPGDVFFVPAGVPHAIGPGILLVEVQEPSDFTLYVEGRNGTVEEANRYLKQSWDVLFGFFDFTGVTREEALRRWRMEPRLIKEDAGGCELAFVDSPGTDAFFRVTQLAVRGRLRRVTDSFSIAIVTKGQGYVEGPSYRIPVRRGDTFFLPACLGEHFWSINEAEKENLEVLLCHPPICRA